MIKYLIDGEEFNSADEAAEYIIYDDYYESSEFDNWLNESYGNFEICGNTYTPAECFEAVDSTAYRCAMSDWLDSAVSELRDEVRRDLECMDPGDRQDEYGYTVDCISDGPEEYKKDDIDDLLNAITA